MKFTRSLICALLIALSLISHAESAYPVSIVDHAGRTVTLEKAPERIVSGYYISTSLLIALNLDDKLVGIEAKAENRPLYPLAAPRLIELPSVGSAKEFDLEGCAALAPDLVILPLKLKNAAETLEALGISAICVNPENQLLLYETADMIASATGAKKEADTLMRRTEEMQAYLCEALKDAEAPGVYLAGNASMLSTAGGAMYQSDMIRLAGGQNVASGIQDSYWVQIGYEQLLAWNPEYIILASDAKYTVSDVLEDPNLSVLDAVQHGNVYKIPGHIEAWDSPVPGGILGSVYLAGVLHPELVSHEACMELINEFYETFYAFTCPEN